MRVRVTLKISSSFEKLNFGQRANLDLVLSHSGKWDWLSCMNDFKYFNLHSVPWLAACGAPLYIMHFECAFQYDLCISRDRERAKYGRAIHREAQKAEFCANLAYI